jgi:hypothetical protein
MFPIREQSKDGRASSRGIPVLYCATNEATAVAEVRPQLGDLVSTAELRTRCDLRVVDCSRCHDSKWFPFEDVPEPEIDEVVWSDIDKAFRDPVARGDDGIDYIPTQILTELFKHEGYSGVAYRSSFGTDGINVALFDLSCVRLDCCSLVRIIDVVVVHEDLDRTYRIDCSLLDDCLVSFHEW